MSNIFLYPSQSLTLVMHENICEASFLDWRARYRAPNAETIVEADKNDWRAHTKSTLDGEGSVVSLIGGTTILKSATMKPDEDGKRLVRR